MSCGGRVLRAELAPQDDPEIGDELIRVHGVSGEALAALGLRPMLGTDIVPAAREAALRDRPGCMSPT